MVRVLLARLRARRWLHRELAWAVWHIGALSGVSGKKYPSLKKFVGDDEDRPGGPKTARTPAEIRGVMSAWAFVKAGSAPGVRTSASGAH
jgi:hypothetical protein